MLCFALASELNSCSQSLYNQTKLIAWAPNWLVQIYIVIIAMVTMISLFNVSILNPTVKETYKISSTRCIMNELSRRTPYMARSMIAHLWPKSRERHAWVTACGRDTMRYLWFNIVNKIDLRWKKILKILLRYFLIPTFQQSYNISTTIKFPVWYLMYFNIHMYIYMATIKVLFGHKTQNVTMCHSNSRWR